jgi:hypothetical protein
MGPSEAAPASCHQRDLSIEANEIAHSGFLPKDCLPATIGQMPPLAYMR